MSGLFHSLREDGGLRRVGAYAFAAAFLAACGGIRPAQASPIRTSSQQIRAAQVGGLASWNNFLVGGPTLWSVVHAPSVTAAARQAINQALATADPTSNPWVVYLTWRRDLDPARFDHYHPNLGPELASLTPPVTTSSAPTPATSPLTLPPPTVPPPTAPQDTTPPTIPPPNPQVLNPPAPAPAPEPSPLVLGALLCGAFAWWRRRSPAR